MSSVPDVATIERLRTEFDGRVIGPDDSGYEEARTGFGLRSVVGGSAADGGAR